MAAKARVDQLRAQGRDIVDFTVGEPDLPRPRTSCGQAWRLRGGDIRYTASVGSRPLLEAIRLKFQRENGLDFGLDELIVGAGAKQLIHTALSATVQAGDEVIISAPYWVSYPDMVLVNDGTPVTVPCPEVDGFKLTPQALERAITPRSKWLLLNTPGNPAGAMYDADELRALARVLDRHPHVWLMTDEIYEHLAYGGARARVARRRRAVAGGPSAGDQRCVQVLCHDRLEAGLRGRPQDADSSHGRADFAKHQLRQRREPGRGRVALTADQGCVAEMARLYGERRDRIVALLNAVPGLRCRAPQGAFYVYPAVEGLLGRRAPDGRVLGSDLDVVMYLLDVAGVAALDGSAYGLSPYLRLSFATSMAQIEEGCRRIHEACARLS